MKQFFKMMFASTLGVMLAMGIILTVLISMTIGYIATVGSTPDYTPKSNTVFKIKLDGTLADNPAENPFSALMGDKENMLSLKDLLETIRIAKQAITCGSTNRWTITSLRMQCWKITTDWINGSSRK